MTPATTCAAASDWCPTTLLPRLSLAPSSRRLPSSLFWFLFIFSVFKVAGLSAVASDLAEGHFDGASILSNCAEMRAAVAAMKEPAEARKQALMQSMKFHEFNFDLAREMEWVRFKWL